MTINNLKTEFSTDDFGGTEVFNVILSDKAVEAIKKRYQLLLENDWLINDTVIEYISREMSTEGLESDTISARIGLKEMLFVITDDDGYMYESETVPYEALYKERFLLQFTGDREVIEYELGDDVDDFEAIYADSLEEAKQMLIEKVRDARMAFNEPDAQTI